MIQSPETLDTSGATSDERLAEMIVRQAYEQERLRQRKPLSRWVRLALQALPRVLATVTIANGLIGLVAVVAPVLRLILGASPTEPVYTAYSFICPQRPSHTWFIGGEPMAMEQRMVAMYLAAGLVGALYVVWSRLRRPLPTWVAVALVAPVVIDVVISTVGIRPSTASSRLWTGSMASLGLIWWSYPRFEAELRRVQAHVGRSRSGHPQ